jgi:hypothetical protein
MNHYGRFDVKISDNLFEILLKNERTGAVITLSGPTRGIFRDSVRRLDQKSADEIGNKLAHYLKLILE